MRVHKNDIFVLILIFLSFFTFELMLSAIYNIDCQREITRRGEQHREDFAMLLPGGDLDLCRNLFCGHPLAFIRWVDFDATLSRNGDFRGDFDDFIKVFAIDDVEAGQTFVGFGKRTIGG